MCCDGIVVNNGKCVEYVRNTCALPLNTFAFCFIFCLSMHRLRVTDITNYSKSTGRKRLTNCVMVLMTYFLCATKKSKNSRQVN